MKIKKIIAVALAFTLTFSFLGSTSNHVFANEVKLVNQDLNETQTETFGVKKWITTKVLKLTSKGLRNGSKFVSEVAEELGSKTGKTFLKHTNTIADALDSLIKRGDVIEDAVIDTISSALMNVGVTSSVARTIANVFTFLVF